jgi:Flavodoxin reductases (ferredoxin-NADPH reductases) family 1
MIQVDMTMTGGQRTLLVKALAVERVSPSVVSIDLAPADESQSLPAYEPGAHIDIRLPNDVVRQYSLCGDGTSGGWKIAVKAVPGGAASSFIHRSVVPGTVLAASLPRNNFPLLPAPNYVFVAGGIGITPLLPMLTAAAGAGASFELHYCIGDPAEDLFTSARAAFGDATSTYVKQAGSRFDPRATLGAVRPGTLVYCCGPASLMDAVGEAMAAWPEGTLHREWFAAQAQPTGQDHPFELVCRRSGKTLVVPADKSVLQVLGEAGIDVPRSCEIGVCSSCEVPVVEGEVDHRDSILSPQERAEGRTMFCCVSRARGNRLVLDL